MCASKWDFVGKECCGALENGIHKKGTIFVNDDFLRSTKYKIFSQGRHFALLAPGATNVSYATV